MKYKYLSLLSVGLLAMIGLIQPTYADWPMAGANPERTSRNSEEVEGKLEPVWYKKFEPYISHKTQLIAANNTIFVSAADGLYALDPESGNTKWQFNTELPLGHSPTYSNGKIYVGGLDHKLYALDANSGSKVWEFSGGRGFQTNPLVVEGKVIAGNRDGKVYAVNESSGTLAWEFETGGPEGRAGGALGGGQILARQPAAAVPRCRGGAHPGRRAGGARGHAGALSSVR